MLQYLYTFLRSIQLFLRVLLLVDTSHPGHLSRQPVNVPRQVLVGRPKKDMNPQRHVFFFLLGERTGRQKPNLLALFCSKKLTRATRSPPHGRPVSVIWPIKGQLELLSSLARLQCSE